MSMSGRTRKFWSVQCKEKVTKVLLQLKETRSRFMSCSLAAVAQTRLQMRSLQHLNTLGYAHCPPLQHLLPYTSTDPATQILFDHD